MELDTILTLIKAGYTKDEINAMTTPKPAYEPPKFVENSVTVKEPVITNFPYKPPVEEPVTVIDETPKLTQTEAAKTLTSEDVTRIIAEAFANFQRGNITTQSFETPKPMTSDEVYASLISPYTNFNKGE